MASVLGQGANISLGFGIGLQGSPSEKGYDLASQGLDAFAAKRAREDAGKRDRDRAIKGLGLKQGEYHPLYQAEAVDVVNNIGNRIREGVLNPNEDYYSIKADVDKGQFALGSLSEASKYAAGVDKDLEIDKASGVISDEARELQKAMRNGDWDAISKLPPDPTGQLVIDPQTKNINYQKAPNVNTNKLMVDAIKDPNFKIDMFSYNNKSYRNLKGGIETFNFSRMPETKEDAINIQHQFGIANAIPSVENQAEVLLSDPSFAKRRAIELINTGKLQKDFLSLEPERKDALLKSAVFEDLNKMNGAKVDRKVENPFAPSQGTMTAKEMDDFMKMDADVTFVTENGQHETYLKGKGAVAFTPEIVSIGTPIGTINAKTGEMVSSTGTLDGKVGEVRNFYFSKQTGARITPLRYKALVNTDQADDFKLETFAAFHGTRKIPGRAGQPERSEEESFWIPAKSVMSVVQTSKDPAAQKAIGLFQEAKKYNSRVSHSPNEEKIPKAGDTKNKPKANLSDLN